jgi:capsular polysaccharide biosynthesis protein
MNNFTRQVEAFARTDILIGIHGAGLGMALYMPPNSAVVEIAPYGNDGRCLLGGGPFSRLSAVMSHNYMIHHPTYEEWKWLPAKTSEFNLTYFMIHLQSFLTSIDFL